MVVGRAQLFRLMIAIIRVHRQAIRLWIVAHLRLACGVRWVLLRVGVGRGAPTDNKRMLLPRLIALGGKVSALVEHLGEHLVHLRSLSLNLLLPLGICSQLTCDHLGSNSASNSGI